MDGNHPKRRKDKYNPYTIGTTGDGRHWLTFSDGQGNRHHFEISAAVFALFDSFELDDLSYLNEVDRHYEQSELTEASLYDRAMHRPATVEESALQSMEYVRPMGRTPCTVPASIAVVIPQRHLSGKSLKPFSSPPMRRAIFLYPKGGHSR